MNFSGNLSGLSLRDLEYVVAVAELRHFGRAAERCAVSQPSLSAQIRKLEEALGLTLFERTSRKVLLTPRGEAIIAQARVVLEEARRLLALADGSDGGLTGRLRLAAIHTLGPYLFPHILPALRNNWPDLTLILSEGRTETLLEELRDGRLDAVLLALPVESDGLTAEPLFFEPFLLAHPAGHRLCAAPNLSLSDLDPAELLLLEEGHCFRNQALSFCNIQSALPRELMDGSSLSTLVQMVGAGIGVTLIPEMAVAVETRSALVSTVRFQSPQPSRTIGMIWRKTSPLAKQLLQISEVVREAADAMREQHDLMWRAQDLEFDGRLARPAASRTARSISPGTADGEAPGS